MLDSECGSIWAYRRYGGSYLRDSKLFILIFMPQMLIHVGLLFLHRANSIQNVCTNTSISPVTRRSSERELNEGSKKRATSASGLDRQSEGKIIISHFHISFKLLLFASWSLSYVREIPAKCQWNVCDFFSKTGKLYKDCESLIKPYLRSYSLVMSKIFGSVLYTLTQSLKLSTQLEENLKFKFCRRHL